MKTTFSILEPNFTEQSLVITQYLVSLRFLDGDLHVQYEIPVRSQTDEHGTQATESVLRRGKSDRKLKLKLEVLYEKARPVSVLRSDTAAVLFR